MVQMTAPFSWERLRAYGETVLNTASQAWDRIKTWRSEREVLPVEAEPRPQERGVLSVDQLSEAMAAQSELAKRLAEHADGLTHALSGLAERIDRLEEQNKQQIARMRAELAAQAARGRWAMTIAGLAIVLAGLIAALPYLARYF